MPLARMRLRAVALACALPAVAALAPDALAQASPPDNAASAPSAGPKPAAVATPARAGASAPAAARPPGAAASRPGPAAAPAPRQGATQQVEITGTVAPDSNDERRRATASRIVIGREELDRMGDSSLGEVIKRLPGVTLGGPPGRGSQIRMRGMGGGYTQILIDGQRMPPGFSLDNVPPEQIERIEVMRAPVAEYGTRAIAGTINVVMRSDFKRRANDARIGGGVDGSRPQAGASWQYNGQNDSLGYNTSLSAVQSGQDNEVRTRTTGGVDDDGLPVLDQYATTRSRSQRSMLFANGRLQFKLGQGQSLDLQPFVHFARVNTHGHTDREAAPNNILGYAQADYDSRSETSMGRLNGTYLTGTPGGGRLQLRFGTMLNESNGHTERVETGGTASNLVNGLRRRLEDTRSREASVDLNGKFSQLLAETHSMSLGGELQRAQRKDFRRALVNGEREATLFGEDVDAVVQRMALYAQDEWEWSKNFSFYLGARWEAIQTTSDFSTGGVNNRSAVLTPLAHMVWKLPELPRDQIRLSLTRSYRSPNTSQLIGQLVTSNLYPDYGKPNTPTSPDRVGNPQLKPELAWSLELGFEHYLEGSGLVSANAYYKRIDNLIRNVTALQTVPYASVPRYLARPENIGLADAAGLELEAKVRAADLWATELPLSLRSNFSLMWSKVSQVKGPDNRLEGQPTYTFNLGADLPLRGTPLTIGGNLNFTPSFVVQQIENQRYRQGAKNAVDAYALWRLGPEASVRLSINNLLARRYDTGSDVSNIDGKLYQTSDTSTRTYTTVNLRAELRF